VGGTYNKPVGQHYNILKKTLNRPRPT